MPALVAGMTRRQFKSACRIGAIAFVDGRDKPGHDALQ
jgi:hypothetical protein